MTATTWIVEYFDSRPAKQKLEVETMFGTEKACVEYCIRLEQVPYNVNVKGYRLVTQRRSIYPPENS